MTAAIEGDALLQEAVAKYRRGELSGEKAEAIRAFLARMEQAAEEMAA